MREIMSAFFVVAIATAAAGAEPFIDLDCKGAIAAAEKDSKIVLVEVAAPWVGVRKKLDETTWADESVRTFLKEKTIAIRVDVEKNKEYAKEHHIRIYPTILLLKADGTEIDRLLGYHDAKSFLEKAKGVLEGQGKPVAYDEGMSAEKMTDPLARFRHARELASKGQYKEALEEYLWCFDRGPQYSERFQGTRLSTLLQDLSRLGYYHEAAVEAMKTRRDAAEQLISDAVEAVIADKTIDLEAEPVLAAVDDLRALNRELRERSKTSAMFDEMLKHGDKTVVLREHLLPHLLAGFIEDREYKVVMNSVRSVPDQIQKHIERSNKLLEDAKRYSDHSYVDYLKEEWVKDGGMYFEAALGTGKTKTARAIAKKLVELDPVKETYIRLIEHAVRAENYKAARWLAKEGRGDTRLTVRERSMVRKAGREIPKDSPSKSKKTKSGKKSKKS